MKNFYFLIFSLIWSISSSYAADESSKMVQVENYFDTPLEVVGWAEYPPFSRYQQSQDPGTSSLSVMESAFLKPTIEVMKKHNITVESPLMRNTDLDLKMLLLDVRSGKYKLFIGAYSNTQIYNGLQMIFPASISNPIHLITIPESIDKIKNIENLKNLHGVVAKTEYLSDFIVRKLSELNVEYVDTPYEGYEKLVLGQADYMLGSIYYNRMMASHYGLGSFLTYSQKPLFTIPVFIAISKVTPRLSQYLEVLHEEFAKPEYAVAVKEEILRIVTEEEQKYEGTVPPSFVQHGAAEESDFLDVEDDDIAIKGGHVIEQKVEEKSIDEVLEGI